jgi:hypothetical protein
MLKRDKCCTDGCSNRKDSSVVFNDRVKDKYCEECTQYFEWRSTFFGVRSVKKLSCADVYSFSLLEESGLTGASVSKALPYLEAKAKGDR